MLAAGSLRTDAICSCTSSGSWRSGIVLQPLRLTTTKHGAFSSAQLLIDRLRLKDELPDHELKKI